MLILKREHIKFFAQRVNIWLDTPTWSLLDNLKESAETIKEALACTCRWLVGNGFRWASLCFLIYFRKSKAIYWVSFWGREGWAHEKVTSLLKNCSMWRQEVFQSLPIQLPQIVLMWAKNDSSRAMNLSLNRQWGSLKKFRFCAKIQQTYNATTPIQVFRCFARVPNTSWCNKCAKERRKWSRTHTSPTLVLTPKVKILQVDQIAHLDSRQEDTWNYYMSCRKFVQLWNRGKICSRKHYIYKPITQCWLKWMWCYWKDAQHK